MSDQPESMLTLANACEYLGLTPQAFAQLHEANLIRPINIAGQQSYRSDELQLVAFLLRVGVERGWGYRSLAWFADLAFACEVGRAILLPLPGQEPSPSAMPFSWLETPYLRTVLHNLETELGEVEAPEGMLITILQSLLSVGRSQCWQEDSTFAKTALYPIVQYYETRGTFIQDQHKQIARDAGTIFLGVLMAFTMVAPPLSDEFSELVGQLQLSFIPPGKPSDSLDQQMQQERERIRKEGLVAIDKIYAAKAPEIHTLSKDWEFRVGVVYSQRNTIGLQLKVPPETTDEIIDNVIDLIRPYLGAYGARVIQLLYQIANDPPYWRQPVVTVQTNDLLDQLGQKRDERGIHRSKNRERLRDVLNAAHKLEIVGEYTSSEDGKQERKAFFHTVLSLIGATYDPDETRDISTLELREKGLPRTVQLRLNFYDGVRRKNGELGSQYVLMPRLAEGAKLVKANYARTHELLKQYFLFLYRQDTRTGILQISRQDALAKANITNSNPRQATATLRKALEKLLADGTLERYDSQIPVKAEETFEVVLKPDSALKNA